MAPSIKLFSSQNLEFLADRLIEEIQHSVKDPFCTTTVLVQEKEVKEWLLLYMAKKTGIAMGLKIIEKEQLFTHTQSPVEKVSSLYSSLKNSSDPQIVGYIQGKKKRTLSLCLQLSSFFKKYERYPSLLEGVESWQMPFFEKSFSLQENPIKAPLFSFGIDFFPPIYWPLLLKAPSLFLFTFSPCVEFWEDFCTTKEKHFLARSYKKKGASEHVLKDLQFYLEEQHQNLANWGKLGRLSLSLLSSLHLEEEELYQDVKPTSLLKQIQYDLLTLQENEKKVDTSISVHLTGNSKLKEVEALKETILSLQVPYHEISVLAPDITPYVPLIEYVFEQELPYRIVGIDISSKSSFKQGLLRIMNLGLGRWEKEEILALFETPSFYQKQNLSEEEIKTIQEWVQKGEILWGTDASFKKEALQNILENKGSLKTGSWEAGFEKIMEEVLFFKSKKVDLELFEKFLLLFEELKSLLLFEEKTLEEWALTLEKALEFLQIDPANSYDLSFAADVQSLLIQMKKASNLERLPLDLVLHFLKKPVYSHIHGSSLHAIRFSSIEKGAFFPAKALFLIGMDEMSFPRKETCCSLDLLKGKTPQKADEDRYLFLKTLFSAKDSLHISYSHLSEEEAKPIQPSILVSDLLKENLPSLSKVHIPKLAKAPSKPLQLPSFEKAFLPDEETLLIQDLSLLARHPWRFFLEKTLGFYLNPEIEENFSLQKAKLARAFLEEREPLFLEKVPSSIQAVLEKEAIERTEEAKKRLSSWGIEPILLRFQQSCTKANQEGSIYTLPPLKITHGSKKIFLVGEIKSASFKGVISFSEDTFFSSLKIWPEALICALALDAPQIFFPRAEKTKKIKEPQKHLLAFIEYYFHSLKAPSPLLPDWADSFLRKGWDAFSKKAGRKPLINDPVMDWTLCRAEMPPLKETFEQWNPFLKDVFEELIKLYPTRSSHATV